MGPRHAPSYEPAELAKAVKAAHDNFGCPACDSTGFVMKAGKKEVCSVCNGHPSTKVTAAAYENLRRLADVLTFVKRTAVVPVEQQRAMGALLARATASRRRSTR